jgi:SAM-dependent methyltransferase
VLRSAARFGRRQLALERAQPKNQMAYDPELYALVHRGTPGDADFYARACRGAGVLELGCGYGRLLAPLARSATCYVGVERATGLLALAQRRRRALPSALRARTALVADDMRNLARVRGGVARGVVRGALHGGARAGFERVIIPHSGLYCLQRDADVTHCLRAVRALLAPGGELIMDAYHADPFHARSRPADLADDHLEPVCRIEQRGIAYDVLERSRWDRDAQRMTVTYRYQPVSGGRARQGTIVHRYVRIPQLKAMLRAAGFRADFYGDFTAAPLRKAHEGWVARAVLR